MKFKNLLEFISYCETVTEETNDIWLLSILAASSTQQEFLNDTKKSLEVYHKFLYEAVDEEMYLNAGCIYQAMQFEIDHYKELGRAIFKKSVSKEINAICEALKNKYINAK